MASARFDISAISGRDLGSATWKPGDKYNLLQVMLQSLLADRFGMMAHHDTRDTQVYTLVPDGAARNADSKLRPAAPDCAAACGMKIDLRWSPDDPRHESTDDPSIFTAVREQLGLRLKARRGSVPVLVIDSIQPPTPD